MRKLFGLLAAATLLCSTAHAKEMTVCSWGVCFTQDVMSADPHIIQVPPDLSIEAQARQARWEAFCKPTFAYDSLWVEHYVYAHEGCEFGRDH